MAESPEEKNDWLVDAIASTAGDTVLDLAADTGGRFVIRRFRLLALASGIATLAVTAGLAWADTFTCTSNPCVGTDGPDSITGTSADETIRAQAGKDQVIDASGTDMIHGGRGSDKVNADAGFDRTLDGDDQVFGRKGDDDMLGAGGDDLLVGGEGDDKLDARDDAYAGDPGVGEDVVRGGSGRDQVQAGDGQFDSINCGDSHLDEVFADPTDEVKNCERGSSRLSAH